MRAIHKILTVLIFLSVTAFLPQDSGEKVQACAEKAGPGAIYLKDFVVSLPGATAGERPPMYRQAVVLRGNNIYRFNLCNEQGQGVLRIYDSSNMLLSSFDPASGKQYNPIQFLCKKTGPYNIVITFKDGTPGDCIAIMSHVKINESRRSR
jgi:hypothetical protein